MTVTLVGDLKHGRTVHSLVRLLALFPGLRLVYVAPDSLAMPQDVIDELRATAPALEQVVGSGRSLQDVIAETDVLYVTRVQKERFASEDEYKAVAGSYCVDAALLARAKAAGSMIVMHPLPRLQEIATEVDADPRAAYFRQMQNGMFVRMAILDATLRG